MSKGFLFDKGRTGVTKPTLCTKHFNRVANYFDKRLAFEFEIDGESCLVCNKTINVEMARWFLRQNKANADAPRSAHSSSPERPAALGNLN